MCDSCDVLQREAFVLDARCRCNFCPLPALARMCTRCGHNLVLEA